MSTSRSFVCVCVCVGHCLGFVCARIIVYTQVFLFLVCVWAGGGGGDRCLVLHHDLLNHAVLAKNDPEVEND